MPNLEQLIRTGEAKGVWPDARDDCTHKEHTHSSVCLYAQADMHACIVTGGRFANKLETALVVEVPAESFRSSARLVPGRDDVYIIPQGSCEAGELLNESDDGRYYSNTHVRALLVLKPPSAFSGPASGTQRVHCKTRRGVDDLQSIDRSTRMGDKLDSTVFPPRVLEYTATIAQPVQTDFVALHHMIQRDRGNKKLFLDNVARFSEQEMRAGIVHSASPSIHSASHSIHSASHSI